MVVTRADAADGAPWICASLQDGRPVVTAAAVFRFPLAGRVLFLQPEDSPEEDTTVLLEGLLYNDGSMNGTDWHRWHVNDLVPGADFRQLERPLPQRRRPLQPIQGQPPRSAGSVGVWVTDQIFVGS